MSTAIVRQGSVAQVWLTESKTFPRAWHPSVLIYFSTQGAQGGQKSIDAAGKATAEFLICMQH